MTNLLAITVIISATNTVALKTNVTEAAHPPIFIEDIYKLVGMGYTNEKWVTTTVVKEDKLTFDWNGKPREVIESSIVSSNTVHLRIKQEWEEVK